MGGLDGGRNLAIRLMEHLIVPTFVLNREGHVVIWNRACERLTGVKARDVVGTRDHWKAFYEAPRPCLADLLLHGQAAAATALYRSHTDVLNTSNGLSAENWCNMPQGEKNLYLAIDAGLIFDDAGEIVAVVESLRDITAQKLAEESLQALASHDGLTAIPNRRYFDERMEEEWRRALRHQSDLSMLLLDVDHFKHFNDTYGHQSGDECLKRVAATVASCLPRAGDVVARYGGEEFAVILPGTDDEGARAVAERIRQAIEDLALPNPVRNGGKFVTASIGLASIRPVESDRIEALIGAADNALYRAKRAGRNRVATFGEPGGVNDRRRPQRRRAPAGATAVPV